jgi:transposase-like protein
MIIVTKTYKCRVCGSENIVKNGKNKAGQAQYHCKDCGAYRVLEPKQGDKGQRREQVLRTYQERASLRGLGRIYGVARQTVMHWIQAHVQHLPPLLDSLVAKQRGDILELDELWGATRFLETTGGLGRRREEKKSSTTGRPMLGGIPNLE